MDNVFTYHVMRDEWVARVGHMTDVSGIPKIKPYWTSKPFPTRDQAIAALEAHPDVIGYNERLMRYEMKGNYTMGEVIFRQTEVDQYDR